MNTCNTVSQTFFSTWITILSGCCPKNDLMSWEVVLVQCTLIPTVVSQLRCSSCMQQLTPGSHYTLQSYFPNSAIIPLLSSIAISRQRLLVPSTSSSKSILSQKHQLAQFVKKTELEDSPHGEPYQNRKMLHLFSNLQSHSNYNRK